MAMFSAQLITVRGDISKDRSPTAKPLRVSPASATMASTLRRPSAVASSGTRASTMAASSAGGR